MAARSRELTVVTYNIRAGIGPGPFPPAWWTRVDRERLDGIARYIADGRADVVALQEVAVVTVDGVLTDMPHDLARATGLEARYAAVGHFPVIDADSGETVGAAFWGNAILSRWPIKSSRTVALPSAG